MSPERTHFINEKSEKVQYWNLKMFECAHILIWEAQSTIILFYIYLQIKLFKLWVYIENI